MAGKKSLTIEDVARMIERISPRLAEIFRNAMKKSPRELTDVEKKVLILAKLLVNPQAIGVDIAWESHRRFSSLGNWLLSTARGDIPGLDTPDVKEFYKRLKKLVKQERWRDVEKLILGETVSA